MFTGIIQTIGTIRSIDTRGDWIISVAADQAALHDLALGASVACSGICLTATEIRADGFSAQLSTETLDKTTARRWTVGTRLNLERALRVGDELGGHIVTGHVDGVARLATRRDEGDSVRMTFEAPDALARYVATKGSVCLDGISLTVNEVEGTRFGVNLIPHTLQATTASAWRESQTVNMEIDIMARYVARMMAYEGKTA